MIVTIFDCETTGLIQSGLLSLDRQPEVIEFVAVRYDTETKDKTYFEHLIKPKKPIPAEITQITTITNEMVENEKPFSEYVLIVKDALENTEAVVAHNLSFDREMIDIEMKRCGYEVKWPRLICTVEQTIPLKGYRLSLTDLHKDLFGEPFSGAHRARQDVDALLRCFESLYERGFI